MELRGGCDKLKYEIFCCISCKGELQIKFVIEKANFWGHSSSPKRVVVKSHEYALPSGNFRDSEMLVVICFRLSKLINALSVLFMARN